ncbi:MAG: membrane protein insertion efficiency factor YidD [Candidatus Gracilibacteria bacterium]|nr:membrane protein insertion efficiency factor YidD [Candidatus Gracilibacteria bacterium]MDD2908560.1 membrane protein insertion efficiency factor YidD [Candidatus Gracilibacteria bacterium]
MLARILIKIIELYQKYLSPDHSIWARNSAKPPYCKFTPSCSDYMKESIEKKGVFKGVFKGTWRILRCNPWNKGGYDPVEKNRK